MKIKFKSLNNSQILKPLRASQKYVCTVHVRKTKKKSHDVTLSRQEGSTMHHLPNAQYRTAPAIVNTGCLFSDLPIWMGQSAPTGIAIVHWARCIKAIKT